MNQGTPILTFKQNNLQPAFNAEGLPWLTIPFPVKKSSLYDPGQVVGIVTASSQNDVQTLTFSDTVASGAFGLTWQFPTKVLRTASTIAYSSNGTTALANLQAALDAVFGAGNTVAAGTYGAGFTITGAGDLANCELPVPSVDRNTLATSGAAAITVSIAHTTIGRLSGSVAAYNSTKVANPSTAPTVADTGTGTWDAGTYQVSYTYVTAAGESLPSPAAAWACAGNKQLRVSAISSIPDKVTGLKFYIFGPEGFKTKTISVSSNAISQTDINVSGTTDAQSWFPNVSTAYVADDGTHVPTGVLAEGAYTDEKGDTWHGSDSGAVVAGRSRTALVLVMGHVKTQELTGLDSNAVAALGRLIDGTTVAGVLQLA